MNESARDTYVLTKQFHGATYAKLLLLREQMSRCSSLGELCETSLAMRESLTFLVDIEKEIKKLKELCDKITCLIWVKSGSMDHIRTPYVTGQPNVKMMASVPTRKNPEAYKKFMEYLGIPEWTYSGEEEVVRPHWPGLVEHLSALASEGKPLPPGVDPDKTYPLFTVRLHKNKEVDEDVKSK